MSLTEAVPVDSIIVEGRHRKDLGTAAELQELADSIFQIGLLQPIGLDKDNRLVFGQRRLEAIKKLGWKHVLCRRVEFPQELKLIQVEHDENVLRKDFTPTEKVAIVEHFKRLIEGGQIPKDRFSGGVTQQACNLAGTSEATYSRTKEVMESGNPELVKKMDAGDVSVRQAHETVQAKKESSQTERRGPGRPRKDGRPPQKRRQSEPATPIQDQTGADVPPNLRDVFGNSHFQDLAAILTNAARVLESNGAWNKWVTLEHIERARDLAGLVKQLTPHAVHQECGGAGCGRCRHSGFLPKWIVDEQAAA